MKSQFLLLCVVGLTLTLSEEAVRAEPPLPDFSGMHFSSCHSHLDGISGASDLSDETGLSLIHRLKSVRRQHGMLLDAAEMTRLLNSSVAYFKLSSIKTRKHRKTALVFAISLWGFQMPGLAKRRSFQSLRAAERRLLSLMRECPHPQEWDEAPPSFDVLSDHLMESAEIYSELSENLKSAVNNYKQEKTNIEMFGEGVRAYVAKTLSVLYPQNLMGEEAFSHLEKSFILLEHLEDRSAMLSRLLPILRETPLDSEKEEELFKLLTGIQTIVSELEVFYRTFPDPGIKLALLHSLRELEPRLTRQLSAAKNISGLSKNFLRDFEELADRVHRSPLILRSRELAPQTSKILQAEEEVSRLEGFFPPLH